MSDSSESSPTIHFPCPQCGAGLSAPRNRPGLVIRCPRCVASIAVPREAAEPQPPATPVAAAAGAESAGEEPPSPWLNVVCRLCHSVITVNREQIGQEVVCPDCTTANVVQPPPPKRKKFQPVDDGEGYRLLDGIEQPAADNAVAFGRYYTATCPVCGTRQRASVSEAGSPRKCPDCQTTFTLPPPPVAPEKKPPPIADDGFEFQLSEPVERPKLSEIAEVHRWEADTVEDALLREASLDTRPGEKRQRDRHGTAEARAERGAAGAEHDGQGDDDDDDETQPFRLPDSPLAYLLEGFQEFVAPPAVWGRWLGLGLWAVICLNFTASVAAAAMDRSTGAGAAPMVVLAMLSAAIVTLLWLGWAVFASNWALAVVFDTAAGNRTVANWGDYSVGERFFQTLYFLNAFAFSGLPAVLILWPFDNYFSITFAILLAVCETVLFPLSLLSMLEENTPFMPVSTGLYGQLRKTWPLWRAFYAATVVLALPTCGLLFAAVRWGGLFTPALAGIALVLSMLAYFRLLGRLARCVSDASWTTIDDDEADEAADADETPEADAAQPAAG